MCRKLFLFITNLFDTYLSLLLYLLHTYISLSIVNIWQAVNLENVRKQIVSVIFHLSYSLLSCYFGNFLPYLIEKYTYYNNSLFYPHFVHLHEQLENFRISFHKISIWLHNIYNLLIY